MKNSILSKYKIQCELIEVSNNSIPNIKQLEISNISFAISSFLSTKPYVHYLRDEILLTINNALDNLPFESDAGGDGIYLEIGRVNSVFTYASASKVSILTIDLKEIIISWIEFLTNNGIIK